MELKELFILRDYQDGTITDIYLCENAELMKELLKKAEKQAMENEDNVLGTWDIFKQLLEDNRIVYDTPKDIVEYNY